MKLIASRPAPKANDDQPIVPPPSSLTVYDDRKVVLFNADGKPLVRKTGF